MIGIPKPGVDIRLNRRGTIQVHGRADGSGTLTWEPTNWIDYLSSEPKNFLEQIERAAGLVAPSKVPRSTPITLTYRVLAALTGIGSKTVHPIEIVQGFIDIDSDGGGPNETLRLFDISDDQIAPRSDDFHGEPGYRFWIPMRDGKPLAAIEQTSATAWFLDGTSTLDLMETYRSMAKEPALVAAAVLERALGVSAS